MAAIAYISYTLFYTFSYSIIYVADLYIPVYEELLHFLSYYITFHFVDVS